MTARAGEWAYRDRTERRAEPERHAGSERRPEPESRARSGPTGRVRVGLQRESYPERRNISRSESGAEYVLLPGPNRWIRRLQCQLGRLSGSVGPIQQEFTFRPREPGFVDLVHVFNSVVGGTIPWVSTFETVVPRFEATLYCHHGPEPTFSSAARDIAVREAMARLASDSCFALLALSQCNLRMQEEWLREFPGFEAAIRAKLQHLPPPQRPLIDRIDVKEWNLEREVRFVFVGAAFFRKGGRELLRVLSRLRKEDPRIHLTVVSTLKTDDYVGRVGWEEVRATAAELAGLSEWIDHFPRMNYDDLLALMTRSHVGLLPTWADTYGYSVLEFQAAGCPVITTDVRALPEINDDECGWLIEVPKNRLGEALYTTEPERLELSRSIETGLEATLRSLLSDPSSIRQKAAKSLGRIRRDHDPETHGAALARIYGGCL